MNRFNKALLSTAAAAVIVFRNPDLFTDPRFWAEDGAIWFAHAFSHDWVEVIFIAAVGYYNFFVQIGALLADRLVPIEHAPMVPTIMSFLIQYASVVIVIWDDSSLWNTIVKKWIVVAFLIVTPRTFEVWLNTNGSQYYLSLVTALILLSDHPLNPTLKRYSYRILLLIAGLTGLLSCILTPLFIFNGWKTKNKEAWIQAGILCFCCIVQLSSVFIEASREGHPNFSTAALIVWVRVFLVPISIHIAQQFTENIFGVLNTQGSRAWMYLGWAIIGLQAAMLWIFYKTVSKPKNILMITSFLILSYFPAYYGIAGPQNMAFFVLINGSRYFFTPSMLLMMMFLFSIDFHSQQISKTILSVFLTLVLVAGLINGVYFFMADQVKLPTYRSWRKEIAIWKTNPDYQPWIWPQGFRVRLEKRHD